MNNIKLRILSISAMGLCLFYLVSSFFFDRDNILDLIHKNLDSNRGMYLALGDLKTDSDWNRLCILGPYSDSTLAESVLGFKINLSDYSNVSTDEGVNALVFLKDKNVIYVADYPRRSADFSKLSGQCYARDKARFRSDGTNLFSLAE